MTISAAWGTRVRWGAFRPRYTVGLAVIVLGAGLTNLISTYSLWFLLLGPLVQLTGWLVLPGPLWRRLLVILPCALAALVLVAGPDFVGAYAVLLAGWLFVRRRPLASYLAVLPMVALSFVLKAILNEYGQNWVGLVSGALMTVACAWLGAALAGARAAQGTRVVPAGEPAAPATASHPAPPQPPAPAVLHGERSE